MLQLTPRLKAVADFVRQGSVVADIGTDHAYVPVYLIKNKIIKKAFACDINIGPLKNAEKTITENEVNGITLVHACGLEKISRGDADDIIIAGMGGELICQIISDAEWCKDKGINFVLQPMTRESELRKYLYNNGFSIKDEKLIAEKSKIYTVMCVGFSGEIAKIDECFALLGFPKCDCLFEEKKQREINRLKKVLVQLKNKENSETEQTEILNLIERIKRY